MFAASGYRAIAFSVVLLTLALLFRSHYRLALVSGDSMAPTLTSGDLLIVDEKAYTRAGPARGDIIITHYSKGLVVKRIVGLPGEEVEVCRGKLYVNGSPVNESHPITPGDLNVGKGKLSESDFATLGDNRAVPSVLAVHPIVTRPDILGKVVLILGRHSITPQTSVTTGSRRTLKVLLASACDTSRGCLRLPSPEPDNYIFSEQTPDLPAPDPWGGDYSCREEHHEEPTQTTTHDPTTPLPDLA